MAEATALLVRGRGGALLSQDPNESLSDSQRTHISRSANFPNQWRYRPLYSDHQRTTPSLVLEEKGDYLSHPTAEISSIEDLEESLRKLKIQVDCLASRLSLDRDDTFEIKHIAGSCPLASKWQPPPQGSCEKSSFRGSPRESKWQLTRHHLVDPLGDHANVTNVDPLPLTPSPVKQTSGLLGCEIMSQTSPPSGDLPSPLKLEASHSIGVKSLLPPEIPVQSSGPERASLPIPRGRSLTLNRSRVAHSCSFSPAAKRTRCLRSRSQSPKPVWKPSSAKTYACAQAPPQLGRSRGIKNKGPSSRQFWLSSSKSGTSAVRSWAATPTTGKRTNERFLQSFSESTMGRFLMERSSYQKEPAPLQLERHHKKEAWCLELKKQQQELERTQAPKPKWYEMKNSQFHYEAHKNNQLLRNSQKAQGVSNCRASKEFQQQKKTTWFRTEEHFFCQTWEIRTPCEARRKFLNVDNRNFLLADNDSGLEIEIC